MSSQPGQRFALLLGDGEDDQTVTGDSTCQLNDDPGPPLPDLVGTEIPCPAVASLDPCPQGPEIVAEGAGPVIDPSIPVIHNLNNHPEVLLSFKEKCKKPFALSRNWNSGVSPTWFPLLHTKVCGALKEGRSLAGETSHFLPASSLDRLITSKIVKAALLDMGVPLNAMFPRVVVNNFRKVFTILTMVSKPSAILDFITHGFDDRCLPISHDVRDDTAATPHDQLNPLRSLFLALDQKTAGSFFKWQHIINPPKMQLAYHGASQGAVHECFHESTVLPFTHVDQSNSGGYGTIFRVQIHPDHYSGRPSIRPLRLRGRIDGPPEYRGSQPSQVSDGTWHYLAVKKLRCSNERDFVRELNVLQRVSRNPHPNIVPFLGSFRLGQDFHFVFPWADGDLSTFWRLNPKPEMDAQLVVWMLNQCLGIAEALAFLHGSELQSDDAATDEDTFTIHGDLKPANILFFREGAEGHKSNVLKLADFGSTLVGVPPLKTVQPDEMPRTTPVYRAPEWDLEPCKISIAADIWSMGCILLEFCIWMIHGRAGLDELAARRHDTWSDDSSGDAFFHYAKNSVGELEARPKPDIVQWTSAIASGSEFSADLVSMIFRHVLVFVEEDHMFGRLTSLGLYDALSKMRVKTERNAAYCELRSPFDMVPSRPLTGRGQGADRKRPSAAEISENEAKRKKTNMTGGPSGKIIQKKKYACHFARAGIDKAYLKAACHKYFPMSRFKEHIKRYHTPTKFKNQHICCRCLENFHSQEEFMEHQRLESQCEVRTQEVTSGEITLDQALNLRSTNKKKMTDEEKWIEMFITLFPTDPVPPPPYHEEEEVSSTLNTLSTQNSMGINEYKEYLRIPLDPEKRDALGASLGQEMGFSDPDMCKVLAAKFRDYQLKDLQKFEDDKLKQTYEIPGPRDLPAVGKGRDHVGDVGDGGDGGYIGNFDELASLASLDELADLADLADLDKLLAA